MKAFSVVVATLGPLGYSNGSGTLAALLTLAPIYWISKLPSTGQYTIIGLSIVVAFIVINRALYALDRFDDPPQIVLDEVIGCLIACVGIEYTPAWIIPAFILFRVFDITKLAGISYLELVPGAAGVLADDIAAGVLANVCIRLIACCL